MPFNEELQKKLAKKFDPGTIVEMKYKRYDLSFKTDEEGNAILLFISKKTEQGTIKGERYAQTLKKDPQGKFLKIKEVEGQSDVKNSYE